MKKSLLFMVMLFITLSSFAQNITGTLTDRDTKEPIVQCTVQLLSSADSSFVGGAISDEKGQFSVKVPKVGNYLLKITSVGYSPMNRSVKVVDTKDVALGNIVMGSDAVMLKGATITGQATKVTLKEDTFIYNAAAYRTPEGSTIEELVKRIPGAQVGDDGKITVNGKEIKKILVDGKEFMTGDTKTALKNLPTSIVDRIKSYDQKSDLSRVTGIDDGEEETVLDFGIKKGMNHGMFSNIDAGVGTKNRYSTRGMGAYMKDNSRFMVFANANNTNDMGFPGGGGRGRFGGGRQGLNASKMLGLNYNYELKDKVTLDASLRWNHSDGDSYTKSSTENFVSVNKEKSFGNSIVQDYSRSNNIDGRLRFEWKPDTMTNIMFRPSVQWSDNDGSKINSSASFSDDPYLYVVNPLAAESIAKMDEEDLMINTQDNSSLNYSDNKNMRGVLQLNRKLGNQGRNVTLRFQGNYGKSDSKSLSLSNVHLYQVLDALGNDSTYQTNRWNLTPTTNYGYSAQFTYSEPLWKATFLQFSYQYQYSFRKSDRSTFDFSNLGEHFFDGLPLTYGGWDAYLNRLSQPIDNYLDANLSRYSEYKNYINEFQLMLRVIREKYNLNVGVMVQPQKSNYLQDYQGIHVDTTRTVTNFSPTLDFRYRFSKVSNLRVNYRGTTSQPSMTDLLAIRDDSDPLNVTVGNPGLKPSFTNNFRLFYNNYIESHQRSIMTFLNYSNTRNSISNAVTYNEKTGGRVSRPENINGNWNAMGAFMFNTAIDSAGYFNINTFTNANYNNYVSYLQIDRNSNSVQNYTRSTSIGERLEASYRNNWFEFSIDGSLNYTHSRNHLQSKSNLDTWQFAYGASANVTLPWGMTVATDLHENSRRGYSDNAMNTNELVWNAQIAQPFLKGNPLTISLQFYDILHNQSNFSRSISSIQRNDTEYNSVNSYAMLHVIYRLNLFGGKEARQNMGGPGGPGFGGRPGGRGGNGPRGGFGGPRGGGPRGFGGF